MKHKGHGEFGLTFTSDNVTKWTTGEVSSKALNKSLQKHLLDIQFNSLKPIMPVEIISTVTTKSEVSFTMPYIKGDTGFTATIHRKKIKEQIRKSINKRSLHIRQGFKALVEAELNILEDSELKNVVREELAKCSDHYPHGYCHGDFGFANMLIIDEVIHMIDYTPSFIESPLMDLATMELSLFSELAKDWHFEIFELLEKDLFRFKAHKDILRMCKVLSFKYDKSDPKLISENAGKFYGRTFRISDF